MKFAYLISSFLLLNCFTSTVSAQQTEALTNSLALSHYNNGEALLNKMKFKEAAEEFKRATEADSAFGVAYYRLAYALNWIPGESTTQPMKKALDLIEDIPEEQRFLVRALQAEIENGYPAAVPILQKMGKIYPANIEMIFHLGDCAYHTNDLAKAEKYFTKVLAIDPNFQRALQHLAWTYQYTESYDLMLAIARRYVSVSHSAEAYATLASAFIETDNVEVGEQELLSVQEGDPHNKAIKGALAIIDFDQGETDKAMQALSLINEPGVLLQIGWGLIQVSKSPEAEKVFFHGLELDPNNVELYNGLGWSLLNQEKYVESEKYFLKGLELQGEHVAVLNGIGRLKIIGQEYEAAINYYQKYINADPSYASFGKMILGSIELIQHNYNEAEQHLREGMAVDSSNNLIYQQLGYLYSEQKRWKEAKKFAEKAVKMDSNSFHNRNVIGWILVASELDIERGIHFAQKAFDSKPDDYAHWTKVIPYIAVPEHTLGLAYIKKEDYKKALPLLEQAAEQLPERKAIKDDLQLAAKKLMNLEIK